MRNRQKLADKLEKNSVAIVHSNDQMLRNGDQFFPYRQNSDLFYLTGIEQEMTILLLCPDHSGENRHELLFIREPDPKLESWEGKKLDKKRAEKISGMRDQDRRRYSRYRYWQPGPRQIHPENCTGGRKYDEILKDLCSKIFPV